MNRTIVSTLCRATMADDYSRNVVGPVCESGDFFANDRIISDVGPGDCWCYERRARMGIPWRRTTTRGRDQLKCSWTATVRGNHPAGV